MNEVNPKNERIKMKYAEDLKRLDGLATSTIDQKLTAIKLFEELTNYVDFEVFDFEIAKIFIDQLMLRSTSSKTKLSIVRHVKKFFTDIALEGHLKRKGARKAIKALRLSEKDRRAGQATKKRKFPSMQTIIETVEAMPKTNSIERRNRALLAFTIISGARDGAIKSMCVGHVDIENKEVLQHPDEVDTKNSKQIFTWFFPVGETLIQELIDYIQHLKTTLKFMDSDPLFPATSLAHDENDQYCANGLSKTHWETTQPIRDIFKAAFKNAGHNYYNPHSFRHTLMALAYELKLTGKPEKSWSQNLGHENLDTSKNSYGKVSLENQRDEILQLHNTSKSDDEENQPLTKGEFMRLLVEFKKAS